MITELSNGRILDCVGDVPFENGTVIIEDGIIKEIYTGNRQYSHEVKKVNCQGKTIMPGLIDAHSHYAVTTVDMGGVLSEFPLFTAIKIKSQLEKILEAGFTTVRDGGGGHWSHKEAVNSGLINGPRILICGPLMSVTGGHGDFNVRGSMNLTGKTPFINLMRLVDGEDDCRKAAREQFQMWCDHLKICITGGCASPNDEPWQVHLSEAEVRIFCEEAAAHGKYVMAHSLNDTGNRLAAECGVRSIEHGSYLSEETVRIMKNKGTNLVSTTAVVWWAETYGKENGAAEWFLRKLANPHCSPDGASIMEGSIRAAKLAFNAGIPVGSGSDYFGMMCGGEAMNIKFLVDLIGLSPYQALKAATVVNADILRLKEVTGSIEAEKWADMIVVDGKPDIDINVITDPARIQLVMKSGQIMKNCLV